MAQGRDGNLYSTTPLGGAHNLGTVFKITPAGAVTILYSFDGTHGANPQSGLVLGTDGNFYGTTSAGGASKKGTVFKITPDGQLTVWHSFQGRDGARPSAPPIEATDGKFYGTASNGGSNGQGTLYKITRSGKFTMLYRFDYSHGDAPVAPLIQGRGGNFYGSTQFGGGIGTGEAFKLTAGKVSVLYSFGWDGWNPVAPLVLGSDGNFYGTLPDANWGRESQYGDVFQLTPNGTETTLHAFDVTDGAYPNAGLVQATDGYFYGTTSGVGPAGTLSDGTIFQAGSDGSFSLLYSFDSTTGMHPQVALTQHTSGLLYGDTSAGGSGTQCSTGCGTFYSLDMGLGPFVSFLPAAGKVGDTIEFLGQGFTTATAVSFNRTAATFSVLSDTYLTATVPNGATTGFVTVTTQGGALNSNKTFRVQP